MRASGSRARPKAYTRLFLRAEDVFGFTGRVTNGDGCPAHSEADELGRHDSAGLSAATLAVGVASGRGRAARAGTYGANPDARSHGETFLHRAGGAVGARRAVFPGRARDAALPNARAGAESS